MFGATAIKSIYLLVEMISFVRKLNPFRRTSAQVPPNVTRSVQADLDGPYPLISEESHTVVLHARNATSTRRGINKLLKEFEKENFTVATLMDQDGRIYFTIDLTDIINNDAELDNIVKMVQKSIEHLSNQSLNTRSDELSKKLKRHFLFESIKKLDPTQEKINSSDYYTVPEKNTESRQNSQERVAQTAVNKTKLENKRKKIESRSISVDETEIQSLLYEASSSLTPEENLELLESLRSSLAAKIYRRIEETIRNIKRKHNLNNQNLDDKESFCVTFSRYCNPVPDPRKNKYDASKQPTQQSALWNRPKDPPQRPQTRRNAGYRRPIRSESSTDDRKEYCNFKLSDRSQCVLKLPSRKPPELVENCVVAYNSTPHQRVKNTQPTPTTRDGMDRYVNNDSRSEKLNGRTIETKEIYERNTGQRRPYTAVDDRRAKMLSTRREIIQKYTRRTTPKKLVQKDYESICKTKNSKEILKKMSKDHRKDHKKDKESKKNDRCRDKEKYVKQKHRYVEDNSKLHKKDKRNKNKHQDEQKKVQSRKPQRDFHLKEGIPHAETGVKEVVLLNKSVEATRKGDKSKRRNTEKKKTKEIEIQPAQTGFSSSEVCRYHRRTPGKRQQSQRKDDLEEVRSSEKLVAVISFGPS